MPHCLRVSMSLCLLLGLLLAGPASASGLEVEVKRVVDGDTMVLAYPDGKDRKVRLIGVDTPEVHVENEPGEWPGIASRDALRRWGERASDVVTRLLKRHRSVEIYTDRRAGRTDPYGRPLVYIELSRDRDLGSVLLKRGLARYTPEFEFATKRRQRYADLQAQAKRICRGVWKVSCKANMRGDGQ